MSHCNYSERLSAFHDGELDAASARQMQEHLSQCADCRQILRGLTGLSNIFATATALQSAEPSKKAMARVHAAIDQALASQPLSADSICDESMLVESTDSRKDLARHTPRQIAAPMRLVGRGIASNRRGAGVLQAAGWLSAVAASLLIISTAWLMQIPPRTQPTTPPPLNVAAAPTWERLATTLQPDPIVLPDSHLAPDLTPAEPRWADSSLAEWILSGLDQHGK